MLYRRLFRMAFVGGGLLPLGCGGLVSSDPDEVVGVQQRTICGPADDMQHVELYNGSLGPSVAFVAARQPMVANIRWRNDLASRYTNPGNVNNQRWCTATLLSADVMITAGHCFDVDGNGWTWPRNNATAAAITPAQAAVEMQVDFNYQFDAAGVDRPITTVNVTQLVEYRLGGVDYALIRVQGTPGTTFGTSVATPFPMEVGQRVTIIQHPNGERKQVHAGPIASLTASAMTYTIADTEGGSSGSGVLNESTGFIHAIHTQGGCTAMGGANSAVPMPAIYAVSPQMQTLALDAAKLRVTIL